jgi:hypothetical protein
MRRSCDGEEGVPGLTSTTCLKSIIWFPSLVDTWFPSLVDTLLVRFLSRTSRCMESNLTSKSCCICKNLNLNPTLGIDLVKCVDLSFKYFLYSSTLWDNDSHNWSYVVSVFGVSPSWFLRYSSGVDDYAQQQDVCYLEDFSWVTQTCLSKSVKDNVVRDPGPVVRRCSPKSQSDLAPRRPPTHTC